MDRLKGKVAIITGAGSGMGEAAARLFHAQGAQIVLADVSGKQHALAAELGDRAVPCDVDIRKADQVEAMASLAVREFGGLDILCNVAGIVGSIIPMTETPEEEFDRQIDINLRGVFLGMKYAIPRMTEKGGSIVNIASTAALIGTPMLATYAASKAGVVALTKAAAAEHAKNNIRANAICPGVIKTPMYEAGSKANPGVTEYLKNMIPMGRIGDPKEIAEAMLFLASDQSSYVTGTVMPVEGGQTLI